MQSYIVTYGNKLKLSNTELRGFPVIDLESTPNYEFIPGNRYLVFWNEFARTNDEQPYNLITKKIHLGPRREGFYDISKMNYLLTRIGIIFKFSYVRYEKQQEWITKAEYDSFLPHIDKMRERMRGANVKEIWSKKKNKYYYMLEFDKVSMSDDLKKFLTEESYIKPAPKLKYYKIIREKDDLIKSFKYFIDQPIGSRFGFDYETCHGFPFDSPYFQPMGLGVADIKGIAAYFDIEWIRDNTDYYQLFLDLLKEFLDKHAHECYTYNVGFELRVTYLLLKHMYPFQDSATINKLEGDVDYNRTLKYTAMRHCFVASWDDEFEEMQDYLSRLMNDNEEHFGENNYVPEYPIHTLEDYDKDEYWDWMNKEFPGNEDEFRRLIKKSWGDPFGAIPSTILGKYCCQDAYYTLLLRQRSDELGYTDEAWNHFNNNMRLGAQLNINGAIIDTDYNSWMSYKGHQVIAYGSLNIAHLYIDILKKTNYFELPKNPVLVNMMRAGISNPFDAKSVYSHYADDSYESGLNEIEMNEELGIDLTYELIEHLKSWDKYPYTSAVNRCRSVFTSASTNILMKYLDGRLEDGYFISGNEKINIKNIDKISYLFNLEKRDEEIVNYLSQFNLEIDQKIVKNLKGDPVEIFKLTDWAKSIINYTSPNDYRLILAHLYTRFYKEIVTVYDWDTLFEKWDSRSECEVTEDLYNKCPHDFNSVFRFKDDFLDMIPHIVKILKQPGEYDNKVDYDWRRKEMLEQYEEYLKTNEIVILMLRWGANVDVFNHDINLKKVAFGFRKDFVKEIPNWVYRLNMIPDKKINNDLKITLATAYKNYIQSGDEIDLYPWMTLGSKFESHDDFKNYFPTDIPDPADVITFFNCLSRFNESSGLGNLGYLFKYGIQSNLDEWDEYYGSHEKLNGWAEEVMNTDITEISLRGLAKYSFCYVTAKKFAKITSTYVDGMLVDTARYCLDYDENGVSTGRWGEGPIYKAFPHYDVCAKKSKRWSSNFHTIPSKSECKRCVTTPKNFMLSYFDISGMEVRTLSYLAQDEFMLNNYAKGVDPYINLGELAFPGHDKAFYKKMRSDMKTTLLGSLYGMGQDMMAERTNKSSEEAGELLNIMFTHMKGIKKFIEHLGSYPDEHDGYIDTILGDKVSLKGEPHDRWSRLGNNLVIQGGSAVLMASSFENIIQDSFDKGDVIIRPVNVVHDSSQNYYETRFIFDLDKYYHERLTEWLYQKVGIRYEFDTLVGSNYYDMAVLNQIDEDTIKLSGTYRSLKQILDKLNEASVDYRILSLKKDDNELYNDGKFSSEFKPKLYDSFIQQVVRFRYEAIYEYDRSKFDLTITRKHA